MTSAPQAAFVPPRAMRRALFALAALGALGLLAQVSVAFLAKHALTQVEAIVAVHSRTLAAGGGLYYDLNEYPYTVSPYGPIFYAVSAALQALGASPLAAGRLVSLTALGALLGLFWRLLRRWDVGRFECAAGLILLVASAGLGSWGVVGQSDALALCFSLAALERYTAFERAGRGSALAASGGFIALAVFTKQTFLAAGAAVVVSLWLRNRRLGARFIVGVALGGVAIAALLSVATHGRYLSNAVLANLNPFSWAKLADHLEHFVLINGALTLVARSGVTRRPRFHPTLHLYLLFAALIWLLTASKVGSDLNYQLETVVALCLAAGWSLDRLRFFPLLARRDPAWITLLQIPLLLHIALNSAAGVQHSLTRWVREGLARQETRGLAAWMAPERRVLSVAIDPLLHLDRPLEVEPLIYTLLVEAGVTEPTPVERELAAGAFDTVALYHDVRRQSELPAEIPSLPPEQLDIIRERYRLAAHIPGPLLDGVYVYEPEGVATQAKAR